MTSANYGIFARVYPVGNASTVAGSIATSGYSLAQLNLAALGFASIPTGREWDEIDVEAIRTAFADAGVALWGLSCSYNMVHPDAAQRRRDTHAAIDLIGRAPHLGVTAVTLCTGSRNPLRMWTAHPDNSAPSAWTDLRRELDLLLGAASEAGVVLGVEPEPGNVVCDAPAAVRLLTEVGDDARRIGIIADSANLISGVPPTQYTPVLKRAFEDLGPSIVCLHAKDLVPWAETLGGAGVVDYRLVASLYDRLPHRPPIIVQDSRPEDAGRVLGFLRARFADSASPGRGKTSHVPRPHTVRPEGFEPPTF